MTLCQGWHGCKIALRRKEMAALRKKMAKHLINPQTKFEIKYTTCLIICKTNLGFTFMNYWHIVIKNSGTYGSCNNCNYNCSGYFHFSLMNRKLHSLKPKMLNSTIKLSLSWPAFPFNNLFLSQLIKPNAKGILFFGVPQEFQQQLVQWGTKTQGWRNRRFGHVFSDWWSKLAVIQTLPLTATLQQEQIQHLLCNPAIINRSFLVLDAMWGSNPNLMFLCNKIKGHKLRGLSSKRKNHQLSTATRSIFIFL